MIDRCHAAEMNKAIPTQPIIFLKPTTSYIREPAPIRIPADTRVDHEGVVIGKNGRNISADKAMSYVAGYCLALDLTARDLQNEAKMNGLPWTIAKGFDTFCPIGDYIHASALNPFDVSLELKVNGELRQRGNTKDMFFKIPQLIEFISRVMRLEAGDLILTGTPKGVGPLKIGDEIMAYLGHDYCKMKYRVMPAGTCLDKKKS